MGLAELISNIVSAVAWPIAVGLCVFWLRDEIRGLLRSLRITKLKMKDFEAEFVESVDKVESELSEPKQRELIRDEPISGKTLGLLEVDPNYAVLDSWKELENSIRTISSEKLGNQRNAPMSRHIIALVKAEMIGPEIGSALQELNAARNRIVHEPNHTISKSSALRYLDLASDVSALVSRILI